jgi:hypothetical protein
MQTAACIKGCGVTANVWDGTRREDFAPFTEFRVSHHLCNEIGGR